MCSVILCLSQLKRNLKVCLLKRKIFTGSFVCFSFSILQILPQVTGNAFFFKKIPILNKRPGSNVELLMC